jgi:hypothetical protein
MIAFNTTDICCTEQLVCVELQLYDNIPEAVGSPFLEFIGIGI